MGGQVAFTTTVISPKAAPTVYGTGSANLHPTGMAITIRNPHSVVIPANTKCLVFQHAGGEWTIDRVLT
jgi:hypothetical protein